MGVRISLVLLTTTSVLSLGLGASVADATHAGAQRPTPRELERLDEANLVAATNDIQTQALASGGLQNGPPYWSPAKRLLASVDALSNLAIADDPSLAPTDTTAIMGPVPTTIAHHLRKRPHHVHIVQTRTLMPFVAAIPDGGSSGIGHRHRHDGAKPAPYQAPDGLFVDPDLEPTQPATIGLAALRSAIKELGQPYVWAAAGPSTFDCSGLVQWAYAHAGIALAHHAATQWNEGRLIPGRDILPGDLIMFGHPIFHVGMYLGSGWMINAPYTGQYVNIVPVPNRVAGVVRP